jgi:hypothetical protein
MTPLHYLLTVVKLPKSQLAAAFVEAGRQNGATVESITGGRLQKWAYERMSVPAWARVTAYQLAIAHGWPIDSAEAIATAIRSYRELTPHATLTDFRAAHPTLVEGADVETQWRLSLMQHPTVSGAFAVRGTSEKTQ